MDPELKARWIQALRSGDYEQCLGVLKETYDPTKAGFCCLGLLCEISNTGTWDERNVFNAHDGGIYIFSLDPHTKEGVGVPLIELFGLDKRWGGMSLADHLVSLNDSGHTFQEIADWIEENVPVDNVNNAA